MKNRFFIFIFILLNIFLNIDVSALDKSNIISFGGSKNDGFNDIIEVSLNEYVAVGSYASTNITINGKELVNSGKNDAIILKYKNGNIQWYKTVSSSKNDAFTSVVKVNEGYVAVGYTTDSSNVEHSIIVKYDFNGNEIWRKDNNLESEYNTVLYVDSYYVCSGFYVNEDESKIPYIVTYDKNGNIDKNLNTIYSSYENYFFSKLIWTGEYYVGISYSDNFQSSNYFVLNKNFDVFDFRNYNLNNQLPYIVDVVSFNKDSYIILGQNNLSATYNSLTIFDSSFVAEYNKNGELVGIKEVIINSHLQNYLFGLTKINDEYILLGCYSDIENYSVFDFNHSRNLYLAKIDNFSNISIIDNFIGNAYIDVNFFNTNMIKKSFDNEIILFGSSKYNGFFEHDSSNASDSYIYRSSFYSSNNKNDDINNPKKVIVSDTINNMHIIEIFSGFVFVIIGALFLYRSVKKNNNLV